LGCDWQLRVLVPFDQTKEILIYYQNHSELPKPSVIDATLHTSYTIHNVCLQFQVWFTVCSTQGPPVHPRDHCHPRESQRTPKNTSSLHVLWHANIDTNLVQHDEDTGETKRSTTWRRWSQSANVRPLTLSRKWTRTWTFRATSQRPNCVWCVRSTVSVVLSPKIQCNRPVNSFQNSHTMLHTRYKGFPHTQIHQCSLDSPFLRPKIHLDGGGPVTVLTLPPPTSQVSSLEEHLAQGEEKYKLFSIQRRNIFFSPTSFILPKRSYLTYWRPKWGRERWW
jgi:hypothetical protein